MRRRSFFLLAAAIGWFAHDGKSQTVHMGPGDTGFTDSSGTVWTPNTCFGWLTFNNPGTFPSPIYNSPAYTLTQGVPIACTFQLSPGDYRIVIHLIEAVKSFNAPQKRVFSIFANGQPVLTNVDVFQRAGGVEIPYDVSTMANPDPLGNLTISFTQVKSSAMFAGIELIQISQSITLINPGGPPRDGITSIQIAAGLSLDVNPPIVTISVTPPAPPPLAAKLWNCNASGPGWDCSGLKLVQIPQSDGSLLSIVGTLSATPIDSKWTLQP